MENMSHVKGEDRPFRQLQTAYFVGSTYYLKSFLESAIGLSPG